MLAKEKVLKYIYFCLGIAIVIVFINVLIDSYKITKDIFFYKNNDPDKICLKDISSNNSICVRQRIVRALLKLGEMPRVTKQHTAIYIPKSNQYYWQWGEVGRHKCMQLPFISIMLTGMNLLHGDYIKGCPVPWSKNDYEKQIYSDRELCKYAVERRMWQVIVLDYVHSAVITRIVKCEN